MVKLSYQDMYKRNEMSPHDYHLNDKKDTAQLRTKKSLKIPKG